ncbi:MAG TPA: hypothetical protein VNI01_15075 [Elusimicrobiota bacterium]|nr:hypothetical protein [Elusimicrobiota bacterium]
MLPLVARRLRCLKNRVAGLKRWEWVRNAAFLSLGFWMLFGLYRAFFRLLTFLNAIELIGPLLVWKLTAMAMLTTFGMVIMSSLIISLTTLFYASDLRFLMRAPVRMRDVFADKSLEAAFFSSWMIGLALFPFVIALARVRGLGWSFHAGFLFLLAPCLLLAAIVGMAFTLALMRAFPSARTRDAVWALSSLSTALLYGLLRFSQPERLVRPDMLRRVAEYLNYLQAPTAPFAPSWWMTRGLSACAVGDWAGFAAQAALLWGSAAAAFAILILAADRTYALAYSGAQESPRGSRPTDLPPMPEIRLLGERGRVLGALLWKERKTFFRDIKHWSQIMLVGSIVFVYLFSISRLPLDTPELKSLVCFLNIGTTGFVLCSLGLRFTFPSVSLEGRSWWVLRGAPVDVGGIMTQKLAFSLAPTLVIATALVAATNHILDADPFVARLTLVTIWLTACALCGMGVGLGAFFPKFSVENIHQIESSAGGFVYMACALGYIALVMGIEAIPMQMHFQQILGRAGAWVPWAAWASAAGVAALNAAAFGIPWVLGLRNLEAYEGD